LVTGDLNQENTKAPRPKLNIETRIRTTVCARLSISFPSFAGYALGFLPEPTSRRTSPTIETRNPSGSVTSKYHKATAPEQALSSNGFSQPIEKRTERRSGNRATTNPASMVLKPHTRASGPLPTATIQITSPTIETRNATRNANGIVASNNGAARAPTQELSSSGFWQPIKRKK
jgi:hypothetical protein